MRIARSVRRLATATVLALGVSAGAAACGSSPAADPLANLSAPDIAAKAIANTEAASSMHVTGQGALSGQSLSFDLAVDGARGCAGSVTDSRNGSFKMIALGPRVWVMPDDAYYRRQAASGAIVPLAALSGKYLRETAGKSALGSFGTLCRLNPLLTAFKSAAATFKKGPVTTVSGERVLPVSSGAVSLYVSDTASPRLVKISAPGTARYDFSGYGAPAAITAPPAAQVADGRQWGF